MKLIVSVPLETDEIQHRVLKQTLETANAVCNAISDYAWENSTFQQSKLHQKLYHDLREQFKVSAQLVVRSLARVAAAYHVDKWHKWEFEPHSPIPFDDRNLTWYPGQPWVSIWTVGGRLRLKYTSTRTAADLLRFRLGESDLVDQSPETKDSAGEFHLFATCDVPNPTGDQIWVSSYWYRFEDINPHPSENIDLQSDDEKFPF
ncbi:MAG: hypothetical protein IT324_34215 [Anaerolineae bacterium]|nr:hypothetical protein [Anaerolineae bacterium]